MNTFRLEALPEGPMLLVCNNDVPGVIGAIGTTIGTFNVNISRMTVGCEAEHGRNIILLNTNKLLTKEQLQTVRDLPEVFDANIVDMPVF